MDNNYIAQRLAAITKQDTSTEIEALQAEIKQLKEQLNKVPTANFKSEAQVAFERSADFENILNAFFIRFLKDKFGADFRNSPHIDDFQRVANQAFEAFEKTYKKEEPTHAQSSEQNNSAADTSNSGENA